MQIFIYIYSYFLIIIRSWIVKVVELFLFFLNGFKIEKWLIFRNVSQNRLKIMN
jgi:hypothetical protein